MTVYHDEVLGVPVHDDKNFSLKGYMELKVKQITGMLKHGYLYYVRHGKGQDFGN
jgi:hypothetical protein